MATTTLTKGVGYWIQGGSFSNNGGSVSGDWTWYIGCWSETYNDNAFGAGCIAFSVPTITDGMIDRIITIPCKFSKNTNASTAQACLSTTAPSDTTWRHGPTSGVISNVVDFSYTATTLSFNLTDGVDISGKTIYLYLYQSNTDPYKLNSLVTGTINNPTLTYTEGGLVYIDNGITFEAYQVYIDNGSSWDLYMPYIDNGTSWDLYS